MALELLCRKMGMTRLYDEQGQSVAVTVLEAGPNVVVQVRTPDRDGYSALQLGFGPRKRQRTPKPLLGHFEKAGVAPTRTLRECRVDPEDAASRPAGHEVRVDVFEKGQRVDVTGTTKGRGTAGVVKRHGFAVHTEGHGTHEYFRHGGAIGAGSFPSRVIKGLGMAGRYGADRVTIRNLEVVGVDPERNLLMLRGGIPGHPNAVVRVRPAVASRG